MSWAQADMKRGFLVQIFFLLPARIRAMRFVWGLIAKHHQNLLIVHTHIIVNLAKTPWFPRSYFTLATYEEQKISRSFLLPGPVCVSTAHYFHNNSGQRQERP